MSPNDVIGPRFITYTFLSRDVIRQSIKERKTPLSPYKRYNFKACWIKCDVLFSGISTKKEEIL